MVLLADKRTDLDKIEGSKGNFYVTIGKYEGHKFNPLTLEQLSELISDGVKFQMLKEIEKIKQEGKGVE
ncbi:MAG: hypothetical protein Q8N77_05640 [Nanoarchaeota archaeon]|nr:hypothetical protein [Nanoarchaeota archaeon]